MSLGKVDGGHIHNRSMANRKAHVPIKKKQDHIYKLMNSYFMLMCAYMFACFQVYGGQITVPVGHAL